VFAVESHIPILCDKRKTWVSNNSTVALFRYNLSHVMRGFSLWLFSVEPGFIKKAVHSGVTGVVVDWECSGKACRQAGADTEINHHTPDDLRRVRAATDGPVMCRINGLHAESAAEIDRAISLGADELLLPMVRAIDDVERALDLVGGRRPLGILIETRAAVGLAPELCALPISRAYVGLNDLAIDRGAPNIFEAAADGTVDEVRRACTVEFGFGGLTLPEAGHPVPCRLLIAEMARLGAGFSFLRRSFHRDMRDRSLDEEVPRLLAALAAAQTRTPQQVEQDRQEFVAAVRAAEPPGGLIDTRGAA